MTKEEKAAAKAAKNKNFAESQKSMQKASASSHSALGANPPPVAKPPKSKADAAPAMAAAPATPAAPAAPAMAAAPATPTAPATGAMKSDTTAPKK
jgi:hypothetical protein